MLSIRKHHAEPCVRRIDKCVPDMTAAMRMEIKGITAVVVEGINEAKGQRSDHFEGEGRKKVPIGGGVSKVGAQPERNGEEDCEVGWCD